MSDTMASSFYRYKILEGLKRKITRVVARTVCRLAWLVAECNPRLRWKQWVRRLEGWTNMSQQVWLCTWWTGHTAYLFRTVPVALKKKQELLCCSLEFPTDVILVLYSKPLPSLWVKVVLLPFRLAGLYLSWILSFLILLFIAWLFLAPLEI